MMANPTSWSTLLPTRSPDSRAKHEALWRNCPRCAAGDQTGLADLYRGSNQLVYSLAVRMLGGVADAEEVTLDVFTQVWKTAGAYDPSRGSVTAWLVTLARSRALDRLRAPTTRQQRELPLPEAFDLPTGTPNPEHETQNSQRRRRVADALEGLSMEQRELVQLAFFAGMTHSELAEHLQQPLGTVKTRIRTAMMKLRDKLEPLAT